MKAKLENLINFDDFRKAKINEDIEEIIPEGLPEDPRMSPKFDIDDEEKLTQINDFLDSDPGEDVIDVMLDQVRDVLLEMEQMGFVDENFTDEIDDKHDGDWISWIKEVIELEDFPEEGLNNLVEIINNSTEEEFPEDEDVENVEDETIDNISPTTFDEYVVEPEIDDNQPEIED